MSIRLDLNAVIGFLEYRDEIKQEVAAYINRNEIELLGRSRAAYCGKNFDFPICRYEPLERLSAVTLLLTDTYVKYREIGTDENIIVDTFKDVSLRANLYYEANGKVGLSEDDVIWFRHIMSVEIFKIGVVQFQPFEMIYLDKEALGEDYIVFSDEQKQALPSGTSVINCHLQKNVILTKETIDKSFVDAEAFFKRKWNKNFRVFLCYSWIMVPTMLEYLPNNSNIRYFANKFDIIGFCGDTEQAEENLRPNSKLSALYSEKPNVFGFGCGIRKIG